MVGNIIDEAITWRKYDLLMRQNGNFNCRYRKKIFVVDQAHTRYGIWEILKKSGLVKEALGKLESLTPELIYHQQTLGEKI